MGCCYSKGNSGTSASLFSAARIDILRCYLERRHKQSVKIVVQRLYTLHQYVQKIVTVLTNSYCPKLRAIISTWARSHLDRAYHIELRNADRVPVWLTAIICRKLSYAKGQNNT